MEGIYKYIQGHNPNKECKILILLDDAIGDMFRNKELNSVVSKLFIRGSKLNIPLVFIEKSYCNVPKLLD